MKFLLPIPKKSHYLFNLRDVAKVFQGLCKAQVKVVDTVATFTRLWLHEMNRVFRDRLLDKKDTADFDNLLKKSVVDKLNVPEVEV